jgi:asparagine synthase (glutamine-hydrolysing)
MIDGADPEVVRQALTAADPLPGTGGFAGQVDDALVRDVLGRYPLFYERDATDPVTADAWSFDPTDLTDPVTVQAGHRVDATGSESVFDLPDPSPVSDRADAVSSVRESVAASVDAVSSDGLAVAFSGGLDSAILAARLEAPLYVAGFPDSHDVDAARSAAALLGADLTVVELTHDDLVDAVPRIARATGRTNAMDVQIALGLFLTAQRVAADGFERLAVGQGADELFGGYAKVAKAPDDPRVEADTVRSARREVVLGLPGQLERDVLTVRAGGVEPVAPLLHDSVVDAALNLPGEFLVSVNGTRKVALREAASDWLPAEIAQRDKKAVQYGSLVSRELDRLARQAGFKRRIDDHVSKYVESLL